MNSKEVQDSGNDLSILCIYWCAQEAVYKAHGGQDVSVKHGISISAFTKRNRGTIWGQIGPKLFVIHYEFYADHVLTWSREAEPLI